jgi:PD-(D/E)XK nuclease superfamily protein
VKLDQTVAGHMIEGRCDFLMRRIGPHHDLVLLDGKGTKWRDKFIDRRQLKWYAMLHRLKEKYAPDRLGFVYWRCEPEDSVDWVEASSNELDELQASVLTSIEEIERAKAQFEKDPSSQPEFFPARPGAPCHFCEYLPLCPAGQKYESLEAPKHGGSGVEDVGF